MGRALTARERDVLESMISRAQDVDGQCPLDDRRRRSWLDQVEGTRAGSRCQCGTCPSIVLEDASGHTPSGAQSRLILSASTPDALVLLFIDEDQLSYLELAPNDFDVCIDEFPAVELLDFAPVGS